MSRVKPLRVLIAVRRRQAERLQTALLAQRALLAERQAAADAAAAAQVQARAAEAGLQDEFVALLGRGFRPHDRLVFDHRLKDAAAATQHAAQAAQAAMQAVQAQQAQVTALQRDIRRNAQRIDGFQQQIDRLVAAAAMAQEDTTEEEAEETSTARFCARQRAAREHRHGG